MAEEKGYGLLIVAVVGIVAIVGLIVLVIGHGTSTYAPTTVSTSDANGNTQGSAVAKASYITGFNQLAANCTHTIVAYNSYRTYNFTNSTIKTVNLPGCLTGGYATYAINACNSTAMQLTNYWTTTSCIVSPVAS